MKYNPRQEVMVFYTIKELGEATEEEIGEYMGKYLAEKTLEIFPEGVEAARPIIKRIISRWEKRNVITGKVHDGARMYSLQDIPWFGRMQMMHVKDITNEEAKNFLEGLDEEAKMLGKLGRTEPLYKDFETVECVFETLTPILGGDLSKEERVLVFPRDADDKPYIRLSWMRGYVRDNLATVNVNQVVAKVHCGFTEGRFLDDPELYRTHPIRVKEGHVIYEAVKPGKRFKTIMKLPLRGVERLDSLNKWMNFFNGLAVCNLRGIGAHTHVYGGRAKLLSMTPIKQENN